jgi:hypothetical protein
LRKRNINDRTLIYTTYPPRSVQGFHKKDELQLLVQRRANWAKRTFKAQLAQAAESQPGHGLTAASMRLDTASHLHAVVAGMRLLSTGKSPLVSGTHQYCHMNYFFL